MQHFRYNKCNDFGYMYTGKDHPLRGGEALPVFALSPLEPGGKAARRLIGKVLLDDPLRVIRKSASYRD